MAIEIVDLPMKNKVDFPVRCMLIYQAGYL